MAASGSAPASPDDDEGNGLAMSAAAFRAWRKASGLTQAEAARALGLKRRMVQYYEQGARDGRPVAVPLSIRLACWALTQGVVDYDGAFPALSAASTPD